jgi:hypothetical protein
MERKISGGWKAAEEAEIPTCRDIQRWTPIQRIRTPEIREAAQIPIEVDLADDFVPVFQQIAEKAAELHAQGLSNRAIGRELGVDPKTAVAAIAWLRGEADRNPS